MRNILLLFFLICILLITNCQKQNPCGTPSFTNYNMTSAEKSEIPYVGNETLVFVSNTGDTAQLIGQGKQDYYYQVLIAGDPECQSSGTNYERIRYTFTSVNNAFLSNIGINVGMFDPPITLRSTLYVYINNITFQGRSLLTLSNQQYLTDTLQIGSKSYLGAILKGVGIAQDTNFVFYTYPEGILKIQFSNNQTWVKQ